MSFLYDKGTNRPGTIHVRPYAIGVEAVILAKVRSTNPLTKITTVLQNGPERNRNGVPVREMDRCNCSVSSKYVRTHQNAVPVRHFSIVTTFSTMKSVAD